MGRMMVGKYTIHDTHPHGVLTVAEVFKFSSNIGATKIARRLGRDAFAEALARFGFGHPTGIGLPGERAGIVRPVEKWGDIGFANVSFGQGIDGDAAADGRRASAPSRAAASTASRGSWRGSSQPDGTHRDAAGGRPSAA